MRQLFGTDGIRGEANKYPITAEVALKVGQAAATVLSNKKKRPVFIIGKDTRLSGYMLEYALTSGLTSMGADVYLVGPMPTPAVAHLVKSFAADAGIMISASHNPSIDNGIKLFDSNGLKLPDATEEKIEKLVLQGSLSAEHITSAHIGKAHRIDDAQGRYIEYAKGTIRNNSLKGLKLVLDCAHGAAYKVAPLIFRELGAELIVLNNQPDGHNINEKAGALHPEVIKDAVITHGADGGITLDGDADRIIMVDEKGHILDGDFIVAIAALAMKKEGTLAHDTVVVTTYTNLAFDALMKKNSIKVVRTKNGDRYVIEEMRKHGYNLGGEYTGHIIFSDFNATGDAMIAGLQVLEIMAATKKSLSSLASGLKKYPQVLINVPVKEKVPLQDIQEVQEAIKYVEDKLEDGRHLVRYSGTEMKARVMVEGKKKEDIRKLANHIADAIKEAVG